MEIQNNETSGLQIENCTHLLAATNKLMILIKQNLNIINIIQYYLQVNSKFSLIDKFSETPMKSRAPCSL